MWNTIHHKILTFESRCIYNNCSISLLVYFISFSLVLIDTFLCHLHFFQGAILKQNQNHRSSLGNSKIKNKTKNKNANKQKHYKSNETIFHKKEKKPNFSFSFILNSPSPTPWGSPLFTRTWFLWFYGGKKKKKN